MFSIIKAWKKYRTHLPLFEAWLKVNAGSGYKGNSADYVLTLWFEEEPSEEIKSAIDAAWDALTEEGEAAKFKLDADRKAAVAATKEALFTANFTDLIPAERKIWMNADLSDSDLDALLTKFPQA
jgi:hypothetical protein